MFYGDQEECLRVLKLVGRESCQYGGPWPDNICDCKYGVKGKPMFEIPGVPERPEEQVRDLNHVTSEQTGCPELRTIYRLIEKLTPEEYRELVQR